MSGLDWVRKCDFEKMILVIWKLLYSGCRLWDQFKSPTNIRAGSASHYKMSAGRKLYPRATIRKIVKAHSKCNMSKTVDTLVIFLDYALFFQTLIKEATMDSKHAGERVISASSIKKVTEV
ncbi:hypothetical protein HI914_02345 [Erysiphe necator]|nr:hypothetical protein HI914_02345 [Erysiphe necator]